MRGPVQMKNVHRITRGGRVYRYHRKTRAKLPDLPENHPDFIAAWLSEEQKGGARPRARTGTIDAACEAFLRSDAFLSLSQGYRQMIRMHLDDARDKYGTGMLAHLKPDYIRLDISKLPPHKANKRLKAWRKLCGWAVEAGLIHVDPSDGVKRKRPPKTDGFLPWSRDHIEAFRERWAIGTGQRAAMELLFWTGARTNDAVTLNRGMVGRDGLMAFKQSKTGGIAYVPWEVLPAFAADMKPDQDIAKGAVGSSFLFLETSYGKPRTIKGLGNLISDAARKAGIERSAHGLRKSRLIELAEAGATAHQIQSWGGHVTLDEVEHYTRAADRRRALLGGGQGTESVKPASQSVKRAE